MAFRSIAIALLLFLSATASAANINAVRSYVAPEHTQIILELDSKPKYSAFSLANPHRLVVDIHNSKIRGRLPAIAKSEVVKRLRAAPRAGGTLRLVLDLHRPTEATIAALEPAGQYNHRLVIQLQHGAASDSADASSPRQRASNKAAPATNRPQAHDRKLIVVIDAGHGGDDAGAVGKHKTREKDVNLAIARRLAKKVNSVKGLQAKLTRRGDYYIGLRDRINMARKFEADVFISIHADAFHNRQVRGASVYALSDKAATSEAARWLAKAQNEADMLGGVSLKGKDDTLAEVLMDLQQSATIDSSIILAGNVIRALGGLGKIHKKRVQQAGFTVLKSPDIPSILVETAFISNPHDEYNLKTTRYQDAIATAVLKGLRGYLNQYAPADTQYAALARRELASR